MKRFLVLVLLAGLAACGQVAPLRPQAGATLPPRPLGATTVPDADKLMTPSDQSRPKRNDELLQDSQKREPDPFDLPPSR